MSLALDDGVAAAEQPQVEPEELVIDEPTVPHEEDDSPEPYVSLQLYQQRNGQQHMPHIAEHDPNEKAESNDVKGRRVYFGIGRYSVGVDDLLRDCQHAVCVKLTGRHLVRLDNVESKGWKVSVRLNDERKLTGRNVQSEASQTARHLSRRQSSIDLPLFLGK